MVAGLPHQVRTPAPSAVLWLTEQASVGRCLLGRHTKEELSYPVEVLQETEQRSEVMGHQAADRQGHPAGWWTEASPHCTLGPCARMAGTARRAP